MCGIRVKRTEVEIKPEQKQLVWRITRASFSISGELSKPKTRTFPAQRAISTLPLRLGIAEILDFLSCRISMMVGKPAFNHNLEERW
jgi:hypothetical protein